VQFKYSSEKNPGALACPSRWLWPSCRPAVDFGSNRLSGVLVRIAHRRSAIYFPAARGFRNFKNYRTRILFFWGKLDLYPL